MLLICILYMLCSYNASKRVYLFRSLVRNKRQNRLFLGYAVLLPSSLVFVVVLFIFIMVMLIFIIAPERQRYTLVLCVTLLPFIMFTTHVRLLFIIELSTIVTNKLLKFLLPNYEYFRAEKINEIFLSV